MDHKFFIDDHLKMMDSVEVLDVSSWFKQEVAKSFKINERLRTHVIENLKTSKSLLEVRLKTQKHVKELGEKLQAKLPRFQNWISSISELQ